MGARIGYSSAESTSWISDSAVSGMCMSALRHSVMTVVTAGIRDGSTTQSISFDVFCMARNSSGTASYFKTQEQFSRNFPLKGSVHTIITSAGVRGLTITECLRGGETALESSGWTSESSVLCRMATGFMGSHRLVISVSTKADSSTQLFTFDSALLSRVACRNEMVQLLVAPAYALLDQACPQVIVLGREYQVLPLEQVHGFQHRQYNA